MVANRTILTPETLPIAIWKLMSQIFLKHMWRLSIPSKFWVLVLSEVILSGNVGAKIGHFKSIFERKCFLMAKPSTFDPLVFYIFGKLSISAFQISGWKSIFERLVILIWFLVLTLREAPLSQNPRSFGHCPNSNWSLDPSPPHSNGHSVALFFWAQF